MSVAARVNLVPDLEALCQDLQRKLDTRSDDLIQMTLRKAAAEEVIRVSSKGKGIEICYEGTVAAGSLIRQSPVVAS